MSQDWSPPDQGGNEMGPRAALPGLHQFWINCLIGLAPLMLLVFMVGLYFWVERENSYAAMQARNYSELVAQELGKHAARVQEELRRWTRDPALRQVLRAGDPQVRIAEEQRLAGRLPMALRVRLVPGAQGSGPDSEAAIPDLSMAGKDLVHRAQQERATTPLEAHLVGQDGMHLAVAAPVLDENQEGVLGAVHVALPMALLPFLQNGGPKWGQLQFQQQVEIEVATLDTKAQTPTPAATPSFWVNVPGTSLRVAAWMTPDSLLAPKPLFIALGSYLLVMGLIAFVLRLLLNRLEQALAADFAGLRAMIEDAANTWPIRKIQSRLSETRSLMEAIRPLLISLAAIRRRHAQSSRRLEEAPTLMAPEGLGPGDLELGDAWSDHRGPGDVSDKPGTGQPT